MRMRALSRPVSAALLGYYRGPDHPFKLRIWSWMRRHQGYRRFTVRYGSAGRLTLDERCFIQREILVKGSYEPEVAEALLGRAIAREVIWDVGANVGSFAVIARQNEAVEQVVCFEPDPDNRAILELNLSLNAGAAYQVSAMALSDRVEERTLWAGPTLNRGMSTLAGPSSPDSSSSIVSCATVDQLVFERGLPAPTLMKVDIEGWEYPALLGARKLLREAPPKAIAFETRCNAKGEMENAEIARFLADCGYRVAKIQRPSRSVDTQENFLAVRPRVKR
jgi:FkbM family methyltransferase